MSLNADNINIAISGELYKVDSTATVSGTGAVAGTSYGYISEEGIEITPSSEVKEIKAFQNGAVVRTIKTNGKVEISLTFLESTAATRSLWFGANASGGSFEWNPANSAGGRFVLDMLGENGTINTRYDFKICEVTEVKAVTYKNGEAESWGVVITATPDSKGVVATVYSAAE